MGTWVVVRIKCQILKGDVFYKHADATDQIGLVPYNFLLPFPEVDQIFGGSLHLLDVTRTGQESEDQSGQNNTNVLYTRLRTFCVESK